MTPVEIARSYIGTPWRHQARGSKSLDCIGLLTVCFPVEDRADYDRNPRAGQLEACVRQQFGEPIPKDQMRAGDVVLMAFPKVIRHVGLLADYWKGGLSILHTWAGGPHGVCETRINHKWHSRIVIVHRWTDKENVPRQASR